MAVQAAALFQGNCTGHGAGKGGQWIPGPGQPSPLGNCPHSPKDNAIPALPYAPHFAMAKWLPTPQRPLKKAIVTNVFINGILPIVDQDLLIPQKTSVIYKTDSVGDKCYTTQSTPAWWAHQYTGIGNSGGRETAAGHVRKCIATSKSVFINGVRAGRFGDALGDQTTQFPSRATIAGASKNVFIGI